MEKAEDKEKAEEKEKAEDKEKSIGKGESRGQGETREKEGIKKDQKTQWERFLPLVEFAYNNTINSSTGKAPFEIVEGVMKVPPFLSTKDKILEANEYTRDLDTDFAKVRETLQKSQERQKKAADCHRCDLKLKENDWVLLCFDKARLRQKKKRKEELNSQLFHVNLWKTFGDVPDDGEPDEQPEVEANKEILVPEQVLAHKVTKKDYIQELLDADAQGGKLFSTGTKMVQGSWDAALLAAGTTLEAMKSILEGQNKLAYALVRPPGHHAQPTQADGYCFLNNAGLAVQLAIASGIKRVAVVDIDVHYGNGTAEGFYERDDVLTISLHMNHGSWGPSHPQTGLPNEVGQGKGAGFNMNIPLPNGCGDKGYEYAMQELAVPVLTKFRPEILVMVIGQDSSAFDPNGRQCLTMAGYQRLGQIVRDQAELHSNGRVLLVQEGGYHITYSAYCLHATIEGVLHLASPCLSDPMAYYPEDENLAIAAIAQVKKEWIRACLDVINAD
ncbi:hypothetical protein L7F22_055681 [Adiantum nelumboides]|nr:hypothetical protein [Adiantum nelumboides]